MIDGKSTCYKFESARLTLKPDTRDLLAQAYVIARREGLLNAGHELALWPERSAFPLYLLDPEISLLLVPLAQSVATERERWNLTVMSRNRLLAVVRQTYMEITGSCTDQMLHGEHAGPFGPGADFVRQVEDIIGIEFLPKRSKDAVFRARAISEETLDRLMPRPRPVGIPASE